LLAPSDKRWWSWRFWRLRAEAMTQSPDGGGLDIPSLPDQLSDRGRHAGAHGTLLNFGRLRPAPIAMTSLLSIDR
jgi:hypothetical protein